MSETEQRKTIYLGQQPLHQSRAATSGEEITISGETFYKITAVDCMRPFFMSIVSHSDHWMFISSTGGLTAGRKNSDFALFPYYTDDKITESAVTTGSKTVILVEESNRELCKGCCLHTVPARLYRHIIVITVVSVIVIIYCCIIGTI